MYKPLLFSALLLAAGCRQSQPLEAFYYPLENLSEGMAYEYQSAGDPADPPFYWFFQTQQEAGATFLTGMYYDHLFTPYQFIREERVSNGMLLVGYDLYENDSTGRQVQFAAEIHGGNVFSFEPADPGNVLYSKIRFAAASDTETIVNLTKNRQFRSDTTYNYGGKTYEALVFYVRELIDIENEGHAEQEFDGIEIYAKGLGLVYFRKNVTDSFITEYKLTNRYDKQAFDEKRKRSE
jgi:hypothetical protein